MWYRYVRTQGQVLPVQGQWDGTRHLRRYLDLEADRRDGRGPWSVSSTYANLSFLTRCAMKFDILLQEVLGMRRLNRSMSTHPTGLYSRM